MTKRWFQSSTVGGVLALLSSAAAGGVALGVPLPLPEQALGAIKAIAASGLLGGAGVALKGRTVAKEPIAWPWSSPGGSGVSVLPEQFEVILEAGIDRLLIAAEQAAAQRVGLELATTAHSVMPGSDITQESAALIGAAMQRLSGNSQDGLIPYTTERVSQPDEPDVPTALLAELDKIAGPPPAKRPGKYNFVAQKNTKLKLSTATDSGNPTVSSGQSVWANEFRYAPDGKHLELRVVDGDIPIDETRFIFEKDFRLVHENGHFEMMSKPDAVQPWV